MLFLYTIPYYCIWIEPLVSVFRGDVLRTWRTEDNIGYNLTSTPLILFYPFYIEQLYSSLWLQGDKKEWPIQTLKGPDKARATNSICYKIIKNIQVFTGNNLIYIKIYWSIYCQIIFWNKALEIGIFKGNFKLHQLILFSVTSPTFLLYKPYDWQTQRHFLSTELVCLFTVLKISLRAKNKIIYTECFL